MPVEQPSTLNGIDERWPLGTDPKYQGDNHFRNFKSVIKATFKEADGTTTWNDTIAVDPVDVQNGYTPVGGIILWSGAVSAIPTNWALCNGVANAAGSAIDLTNRMVICAAADAGGDFDVGDSGGSAITDASPVLTSTQTDLSVTDGHILTISELPSHDHGGGNHNHGLGRKDTDSAGGSPDTATGPGSSTNTSSSGNIINAEGGGSAHSHTITGGNHSHDVTIQAYYALAYIERIS